MNRDLDRRSENSLAAFGLKTNSSRLHIALSIFAFSIFLVSCQSQSALVAEACSKIMVYQSEYPKLPKPVPTSIQIQENKNDWGVNSVCNVDEINVTADNRVYTFTNGCWQGNFELDEFNSDCNGDVCTYDAMDYTKSIDEIRLFKKR
jgi:hypothetical protein